MKNTKVVLVGEGRFGSLVRKELEKHIGVYVQTYDSKRGFVNVDWNRVEYVIFAVPMENFEEVLLEVSSFIPSDAVVLDVCSLKMFACEAMKDILPDDVEIIGTHPLFGPQSAPNGVEGQRIVLCNVSAREETIVRITDFLNKVGLHVYNCSPEFHDKQMAVSQALTHFIGRIAEKMNLQRIPLATKSYDDLYDIIELVKGGSPELFRNMQQMNPFAAHVNKDFLAAGNQLFSELFTE